MSSSQFRVVFDGPALKSNEMDVRELSAALVALNKLFEEADTLINGGRTEHSLKVRGSFKTGSFKIDFASYQGMLDRAKDLLLSDDAGAIISAHDLVQVVIFGSVGAYSLVRLLKWLGGLRPTKIIEDPDGGFRVYKGDKWVKAEEKVVQLYRDHKVRKALEAAITAPLSEGRVDAMAFTNDDGKNFELITIDEASYFAAPEESAEQLETSRFETNVSLVRISFKEGNKWSVFDGANALSVYVEDQDFLERMNRSEVSFSKGDILRVRIRLEQSETSGGLRNEYYVEKVLDHRPPASRAQLHMF